MHQSTSPNMGIHDNNLWSVSGVTNGVFMITFIQRIGIERGKIY